MGRFGRTKNKIHLRALSLFSDEDLTKQLVLPIIKIIVPCAPNSDTVQLSLFLCNPVESNHHKVISSKCVQMISMYVYMYNEMRQK